MSALLEDGVVRLHSVSIKRFVFRLTPPAIRAMMPERCIGVYILFRNDTPIYVGRSDHCLRRRLSTHNHLQEATHVAWEFTPTVQQAYVLEAHLFHQHRDHLINKIHPALPEGSSISCPFCVRNTEQALARAFNRVA
ncbi:GIY-YIG nuclease family protein [Planomonospora parontospora]|uniref:GIY-YIG nuclease family protein n=3 Tax=Planomonospora parontospora TaxID=58119 RepID=UPI0027DE7B55|nr:GIY-YIG nuclease family protein [Planomonospora parontospora]